MKKGGAPYRLAHGSAHRNGHAPLAHHNDNDHSALRARPVHRLRTWHTHWPAMHSAPLPPQSLSALHLPPPRGTPQASTVPTVPFRRGYLRGWAQTDAGEQHICCLRRF